MLISVATEFVTQSGTVENKPEESLPQDHHVKLASLKQMKEFNFRNKYT